MNLINLASVVFLVPRDYILTKIRAQATIELI
jgi:hypothetical protein